MRFAQTLIVSSFVLLSSTMLADVVLAESREPQAIAFKCKVPAVGKERCGDADLNLRVNKTQQLFVNLQNLPKAPKGDAPNYVEFFVYHAVTNDELAKSERISENGKPIEIWKNHKDQAVDVYTMVRSNFYAGIELKGDYVITY